MLTVSAPTIARAQDAAVDTGEIIVNARRESESLQDVPVSVQVVTGSNLQKLAITNVEEVSKLAPGLTLVSNGSSTAITLRGVTWQPGSGTPATPIYFNDAPFDPGNTITSLFDVGQIEVLRGPQGTTRGAPSISGAVTITTRRPDLEELGGYVQGLYGSGDHRDLQAAINVPIIKNVLAVRLATNIEDSDGTRVFSVNSSVKPKFKDRSYRATVLFNPTDTVSIVGMYQRRRTQSLVYSQVAGTGSPGLAALNIPANFNGPALSVKDQASVQDLPSEINQHVDLLTINATWEVFGHKLSYNYGNQMNTSPDSHNAVDPLNILPGFEAFASPGYIGKPKFRTHEIRISSMPDPDRPFEYDIGWFSKRSSGVQSFDSPTYLPGAFGSPISAVPGNITVPNDRYVLNSATRIQIGQVFDSFYGNIRLHPDDKTELSGGFAIIRDRIPVDVDIKTFAAFNAFTDPRLPSRALCPFAAPGAIASPVYTSGVVCEVGIPDGFRNATQANNDKYTAAIYNFSLSRKINDELLVYATTGSSFRTGLPALNNPGLPDDFVTPSPEKAKSYEVGVKATFGRAFRINASAFQLDYKNQLTAFEGINYFNTVSGRVAQTSLAFYRNIDARVRGFEVEIGARPIENLNLGANISYSKIKSRGGQVPCNDGVLPTEGDPIHFCSSAKGQVLNALAPFQATVNGSYDLPITDAIGGYFRFNVNYQGKNPNFGNFRQTDGSFREAKSYALVDLFAGLAGSGGAWDLGFYAKNVFNQKVELSRIATFNSVYPSFAAASGYDVVRSTRPRELGVTLRYAFGSR
ncbi:TonB-dependent receptor [Novosphingobium barchaimii]|nr:TonB-dependent receptor [Novosphingobium barchaimii]